MNIELQLTISERDYVSAQWLHIKPRPFLAVISSLLLVLYLMILWSSFFLVRSASNTKWVLLAVLVYGAFAYFAWMPYKARRSYRQYKAMHAEQRWFITDTAWRIENERGNATLPWSDFVKWKYGNGFFLLYPMDSAFHVLPCRAFPDERAIEDFRNFLGRSIGPPTT